MTIRKVKRLDGMSICLAGVVDETLEVGAFTESCPFLIIDLEGVQRITSFGVRQWVTAIRSAKVKYIAYINVHPSILVQFNSVAGFAGTGQLVTFFLPYSCTECGEEFEVSLDLRSHHSVVREFKPPSAKCPKCQSEGEFDDLPEVFFSYAASVPPPAPPSLVSAAIDGRTDVQKIPFQLEQDVANGFTAVWLSGLITKETRLKRVAESFTGVVLIETQKLEPTSEADAFARFGELCKSQELSLEIFIARLPKSWWPSLETIASVRPVSVCSVSFTSACAHCKEDTTHDWTLPTDGSRSRPTKARCLKCASENPVTIEPDSLAVVWRRAPAQVPSAITEYLNKNLNISPVAAANLHVKSVDDSALGRYTLTKKIGTGGMAEVFLATQEGLGGFKKKVVVKKILPHMAADGGFINMFVQEARLAARISHPNVVQTLDVGKTADHYYIAMEYVQGHDLNRLINAVQLSGALVPFEVAAVIIADVCEGLHAAHTWVDETGRIVPVVHRDISPHNILVSVDGRVKVSDFGIARASDLISMTPIDSLRGKLAYMAPELLRRTGSVQVDPRADVFAAGVVLFQLLTLNQPFRQPTEVDTIKAILGGPLPDVRQYRPKTPTSLAEVVLKAMAREIEDRYQTALEFHEALEKYLRDAGTPSGFRSVGAWVRATIKDPIDEVTPTGGSTEKDRVDFTENDRTNIIRPTATPK